MSADLVPAGNSALEEYQPLRPEQLRARLALIQEVQRSVMVRDEDYGVIPGTDKPTLFKAGAEKLCVTFRLAASDPLVEDLGLGTFERRYRVRVPIVSASGSILAVGTGECSSEEEKYAWRRPAHQKEYDHAPEDRRRVKYARNGEEWSQVRNHPADVANTILKMAHKRAYIHGVIMATGASSIFGQDVEDLPDGTRESVVGDEATARTPIQPPQRKSAPAAPPATAKAGALTVTNVEKKSGESNGKAWTVYVVHFSDGRKASTFHEQTAQLAAQCKAEGAAVELTTEPGRRDGTLNIAELSRVVGSEGEARS